MPARTFAVDVNVTVVVTAPSEELAGAGALAALHAAGFGAADVDDVIDVDQPLSITITAAGRERLAAMTVQGNDQAS